MANSEQQTFSEIVAISKERSSHFSQTITLENLTSEHTSIYLVLRYFLSRVWCGGFQQLVFDLTSLQHFGGPFYMFPVRHLLLPIFMLSEFQTSFVLFQPQMDIPADRVQWAPQILEEEQEDMVDSPTPPGPDPSVEAVREASGDKSWHVLSEGAASGSTGDVSQMHDLQQHVQ